MVVSSTAPIQPSELHIQLLGEFSISLGERRIQEAGIRSRRVRSLIKLLALAPDHRLHRDQVLDALWPEADLTAGTNSLHQTLFTARKVLEPLSPDCLTLEEGFLSLSGGAGRTLIVDVDQFETAAAQVTDSHDVQRYQSALALYIGELLPVDRYEEWAIRRRDALKQTYLQLLFDLAGLQEAARDYPGAIETLQRLLEGDPSHEEAHVALMRLYALSGHRQQALRQYQTLREVLQAELEVEPSEDTLQLYQSIREGEYLGTGDSKQGDTPRFLSLSPPAAPLPRHNLPSQLTAFIGREKEIVEVTGLLRKQPT